MSRIPTMETEELEEFIPDGGREAFGDFFDEHDGQPFRPCAKLGGVTYFLVTNSKGYVLKLTQRSPMAQGVFLCTMANALRAKEGELV